MKTALNKIFFSNYNMNKHVIFKYFSFVLLIKFHLF